jgi:hypothetical protein
MRIVTRSVWMAAALGLLLVGNAAAQLTSEAVLGHADVTASPELGNKKPQGPTSPLVLTTIYDNSTSAANFGVSSTDLAATWGDELLTTGTGLLSTHKFSIFNSAGGNLLTALVGVSFYDAVSTALLGSYSTNINFGAGLPVGFFSTVTVTGLDPLVILLSSPDLIVTQTVISKTGPTTRLGIASLTPPTVGTSPASMYIQASTINGGIAGFYTFSGPADPLYQVVVNPAPVSTAPTSWGRIKQLYR